MKIEEQVLSREQMAHLAELGVDTSDASMVWFCCKDAQKERWYLQINNELSQGVANIMKRAADLFVPTYTIGELIEKLPKEIGFTFSCASYRYERNTFAPISRYQLLHTHNASLKEDLYNALCWVAENHKEIIK